MSKFNWGHGITLFFILFVGTLIMVLVASRSVDHSLVVDDYYAKDLAYQQHYNATKNNNDSSHITIEQDKVNNILVVTFKADKKVTGEVSLYRPSDKTKDFIIHITTNIMEVPLDMMIKGKWKIKTNWTSEGKPYYYERELFI